MPRRKSIKTTSLDKMRDAFGQQFDSPETRINEELEEENDQLTVMRDELERRLKRAMPYNRNSMDELIRLALRGNKIKDLIKERFPNTATRAEKKYLQKRIARAKKLVVTY